MTPEEQLQVFVTGWAAMKWLAAHAKTNCPGCTAYRKLVESGRDPKRVLDRRCALARKMRDDYLAVDKLIATMRDGMECDLVDPSRPDIRCSGPADWALAERSRRNGRLVGFVIGCEPHVRFAEARAIVTGSTGTFTIERLEDVAREDATKMR